MKSVMSIDDDFYDQVSAARFLMGLIETANKRAEFNAGSVFFELRSSAKNLNVFFSCD
jgi:hypothetical protein